MPLPRDEGLESALDSKTILAFASKAMSGFRELIEVSEFGLLASLKS